MEPFAQTIGKAKKTSCRAPWTGVDWNAELVRGDLGTAVQQLKRRKGVVKSD